MNWGSTGTHNRFYVRAVTHYSDATHFIACLSPAIFPCVCLLCFVSASAAAIITCGDVDPTDPAAWDSDTRAYIGKDSSGALVITDGDDVSGYRGYIGYNSGSSGVVVVHGPGSTWMNYDILGVAYLGSGSLSINGGGEVIGLCGFIGCASGSIGEVTVNGIDSNWMNSQHLYIGHYGSGELAISGGGSVSNTFSCIGFERGSTGTVTVDGPGSTWTNDGDLDIGVRGNGTLAITDGGEVIVRKDTSVSHYKDLPNTIYFDNGTLSTGTLFCASGDLSGTGTINAHGLVCDVDLVFNATYGLHQILNLARNPGQNITINLNVDGSAALGVGHVGAGSMSISDGRKVASTDGYIGYSSMGVVTVDGAGSTWTIDDDLLVGHYGTGRLTITGGGVVRNRYGYVGCEELSTGEVIVDGAGSTWVNDDYLYFGHPHANCTLTITGNGLVCAETLSCHTDRYSSIKMDTGGMLALKGEGDDSLAEFLGLVHGRCGIRYWDNSISDWTDIRRTTYGEDYTLSYLTGGCLDGYTVLCVGALDPGMVGDATYDGVVNEADAAMLARYWNTQSGALWAMGDFNGDGAVNNIDATMLAANWTNSTSNGSVPEPSTLVGLLGVWLTGILALARRK